MAEASGLVPPENAPPQPEPSPCKACGEPVEAVWLPFPQARPGWWPPTFCQACDAHAQGARRQQRREKEHRVWLAERIQKAGMAGMRREKTFDAFEPLPGTGAALARAKEFAVLAATGSIPRRGLLVVGGNGSGKTYLVTAILNHVLDRDEKLTGIFLRFADYLQALQREFGGQGGGDHADELRRAMATVDVLVLDDLGAAAHRKSGWDSEELLHLLEEREGRALPLLATTDVGEPGLIRHLGNRVVSRLWGMCEVVVMADGKTVAEDYRKRPREE